MNIGSRATIQRMEEDDCPFGSIRFGEGDDDPKDSYKGRVCLSPGNAQFLHITQDEMREQILYTDLQAKLG